MEYQKGFIFITNEEWNKTVAKRQEKIGVIWTRGTSFKAINKNEPVFFVERKSRLIRGYGIFKRFEVNTTRDSWFKYGTLNGAKSYEDFLLQLNFPNDERGHNRNIGNLIVKEIIWSKKLLYIHDININFSKATVRGKTINSIEVALLLREIHK